MKLALRLGRTLRELEQSMSHDELMMWMEFDKNSPIGDERTDFLTASVVSATAGKKGDRLDKFLLKWGGAGEEEDVELGEDDLEKQLMMQAN